MRKILLMIVIIIFLVCIFYDEQEEIRVRIVPNSDSKEDLEIKEIVKNITVCYLMEAYEELTYV